MVGKDNIEGLLKILWFVRLLNELLLSDESEDSPLMRRRIINIGDNLLNADIIDVELDEYNKIK